MPAPFNHPSGLAGAYDRSSDNQTWGRVVFREAQLAQGAEWNETQSIIEARNQRVGNLVSRDGDRITGADILVDPNTGTVVLGAGSIYVQGDVRPVAGATLNEVPMTGSIKVGVRLTKTLITEVEDPNLLGLHPGSIGEGEPGAGRVAETIAWAWDGDGGTGDLFSVYLLKDGVVVDQTPPPQLSGVTAAIASYDRDAHGNYVVNGCEVSALGKYGTEQVFSISEGIANIWGYKRSRAAAIIHKEVETWDVETIAAEVHSFDDGGTGTAVITVNHAPIAALNAAIITKETTQTVTKGTTNSADALPHSSVTSIIEVKQGGTTYAAPADYSLTNDAVNWAAGGTEPVTGSTYTVKYRYLVAVTPVTQTDKTVTVTGGVTGTTVLIGYDWKLPRIDLVCLDQAGLPVYVKGTSMRVSPQPPMPPVELLPLATVENNFMGKPTVRNVGVRSYHYTKIDRMYNRLVDLLNLMGLERLKNSIDFREPVAKKGVFVDPLIDDTYRDLGVTQNAAVFQGAMQLPISPSFHIPTLTAPVMLNFTEEVVIEQALVTGQIKVNPYNSYALLPCEMKLEPPVDFWVDQPENALQESFVTQQIVQEVHKTVWGKEAGVNVEQTIREQVSVDEDFVGAREALVPFMRQIEVSYTIKGFGVGEVLETLQFGGIDVLPGGTITADSNGQIASTFTIPANMPTGRVMLYAEGAGGSYAQAMFVSNGYYEIDNIARVTTITQYITRTITTTKVKPPANDEFEFPEGGKAWRENRDPVAQTFMLPESRQISSISVKMAALGDTSKGLLIEVVRTEHGFPTGESLGQARVDLTDAEVGDWVKATFALPIYIQGDAEYAFIVRTDDNAHALATAAIGGFDPIAQEFVGAQPYSVGMMLSSATATTWTAHQNEDLAFRIEAALFAPETKTLTLGTFNLSMASDIKVRASTMLPSADTSLVFEVERADGEKKLLNPNVNWEMSEFVTEAVILRAKFAGSAKLSPVLFPGVIMVAGSIATSATYVSRAMTMGTAVRLSTFLKLWLPSGSDLTVQFDKVDGTWLNASVEATETLDLGWLEREYRYNSITAVQGRMKITLTGSPAARPAIQDLRAVSI